MLPSHPSYRGRLAPSPTGYLHLGHARTFWTAQQRARSANGTLILRNEDLDSSRAKSEFVTAMLEDLAWFGLAWQEGPDIGGPFAPYSQRDRQELYLQAFLQLQASGHIYPCHCSRKDIQRSLSAPHAADDEPIYPGTCRPVSSTAVIRTSSDFPARSCNWRFRVPNGDAITFIDGQFGPQTFSPGKDFGDFVVWRQDGFPSYQLSVVVDDAAMRITEVVRGADLLLSTARQILLYQALGLPRPDFYHCQLMTDETGVRLAKRHASLGLRTLRAAGAKPEMLRESWLR